MRRYKRTANNEEAWEEYNENLSRGIAMLDPSEEDIAIENAGVVCDDCYQLLKEKFPWMV